MERRQPYTEVPYRPATEDPIPGSPTSDIHHRADSATFHHSGAHPNAKYVGESGETPTFSAAHAQAAAEEKKEASAPVWYKGATMVKRIIGIVVLVVIVFAGYLWYKSHKAAQDIANGEVYSNDITSGGTTRSGEPSRSAAKPFPGSPSAPAADGYTVPPTDSLPANAPNGARFSGTGKFQVYRQGNVTYRINTETGESCILFATEDEWRKPIVFNRGCQAS